MFKLQCKLSYEETLVPPHITTCHISLEIGAHHPRDLRKAGKRRKVLRPCGKTICANGICLLDEGTAEPTSPGAEHWGNYGKLKTWWGTKEIYDKWWRIMKNARAGLEYVVDTKHWLACWRESLHEEHWLLLQIIQVWFELTYDGSEKIITPVSGWNMMSGLWGHHAGLWHTYLHAGKHTHKHKNKGKIPDSPV